MKEIEKRYSKACNTINKHYNLLNLPQEIKSILKATTDFETKTKMLEAIAEQLQKEK